MTDKKHEGLPVSGYRPQSEEAVRLVNEFKADEERLLRKLDSVGAQQPGDGSWSDRGVPKLRGDAINVSNLDPRWTAIARSHFEQGFMALNRAVFQPQRVRLPEDEK